MSESLIMEPPAAPDPNLNILAEYDSLLVPPLDPLFFPDSDPISTGTVNSDLDIFLEDNGDFDFSIDLPDDFFDFPSDADPSVIPTVPGNSSEDFGVRGISGHQGHDEVAKRLNCYPSESGSWHREHEGRSGDRRSDSGHPTGVHSPAPSHGSGSFESGASVTLNPSSPGTSDPGSDQKAKEGGNNKGSVGKRKMENEDSNGESRSCKLRISEENAASVNEEEEKRKARLVRNRESAHLSRQRKKQYVEELEGKVKSMHSTIAELNSKMSYIMAENAALRQQISGGVNGASVYSHVAAPQMPYQWMPYPPHLVTPFRSQVPRVAIPKLKIQPMSGSKAKKPENKKNEAKSMTKKVASISFIGLLFFIFLFGALIPFVNVNYGGSGGSYNSWSNNSNERGMVLMVNDHLNVSDISRGIGFSNGNYDASSRVPRGRGGWGGVAYHVNMKEQGLTSLMGNASEPLFASLYVPRNDKLVKIDGNLVIHSVLASEKAMASNKNAYETKRSRETSLTIPSGLSSALAIPETGRNGAILPHLDRNSDENLKALPSGSEEGKLPHQWFHEGGIGTTMLNYGMCTEVFQFDVAPGVIIPSSPSVSNISSEYHQNATTRDKKRESRKILQGLPLPLMGSESNNTRNNTSKDSKNESFQGENKKSSSPMVVSVLLDQREGSDSDTDRVMAPKSLSRIFVVVLLDSVKYVTYSCVLPRSGLHLVTT